MDLLQFVLQSVVMERLYTLKRAMTGLMTTRDVILHVRDMTLYIPVQEAMLLPQQYARYVEMDLFKTQKHVMMGQRMTKAAIQIARGNYQDGLAIRIRQVFVLQYVGMEFE